MGYVPEFVFTLHEEISKDILLNASIAVKTKLVYPEKVADCPNCIFDSMNNKSSGRYQSGGPIEFTAGICPYCHGKGRVSTPSGDIIQLRVYYDKASFRKIGGVDIPECDAMCIGFIENMPDMTRASSIIPSYEIAEYGEKEFGLTGEPMPWGLSKDKFFVAYLKRK